MERLTTNYINRNGVTCYERINISIKNQQLIDKLGEFEDLEEQGLLLRLPCKVGDFVYIIKSEYTECTAYEETYNDSWCYSCAKECDSKKIYKVVPKEITTLQQILNRLDDIGKTVFLTREEAEQALKQMGEAHDN